MHLYHYTVRSSALEIVKAGVIRAHPHSLKKYLIGSGPTRTTDPVVWLTTYPAFEATILCKMQCSGHPLATLTRFVVRVKGLSLDDYIVRSRIPVRWWKNVVLTGRMAGAETSEWRLYPGDIPNDLWVEVNQLSADLQAWVPFVV